MTGEQQIIQIIAAPMPAEYWWWTGVIVPIAIAYLGYKRMKWMNKDKDKK